MFSLNNLIIGLGMIIAGVALVKYTYQAVNVTGPQDWVERIVGPGSTYGVYKIFGVIVVFIGILVVTGFGNNVMGFFLEPFRSLFPSTR